MQLGNRKILLLSFTVVVMLCQNLALGLCHHSNTIFLEQCPCSDENKPCPCDDGCSTFLEFTLDTFAKSDDLTLNGKIDVATPFEFLELAENGRHLFELQPLYHIGSPDPPSSIYGRTMLSRYCVARI